MDYLREFDTTSEFVSAKDNILKPFTCLVNENHKVHYSWKPKETIQVLYKTEGWWVNYWRENPDEPIDMSMLEPDYVDFYFYDGTYEYNGVTYHKWKYTNWDRWVLTDTTDFTGISLDNPYEPVGYIQNDEFTSEYNNDIFIASGALTYVERNTSSINFNGYVMLI